MVGTLTMVDKRTVQRYCASPKCVGSRAAWIGILLIQAQGLVMCSTRCFGGGAAHSLCGTSCPADAAGSAVPKAWILPATFLWTDQWCARFNLIAHGTAREADCGGCKSIPSGVTTWTCFKRSAPKQSWLTGRLVGFAFSCGARYSLAAQCKAIEPVQNRPWPTF